jgi:hypothetical protein
LTEDPKDVAAQVVAAIVEVTSSLHGKGRSTSCWSKAILRAIAQQASPERYYVCGSGLESAGRNGEWLFDQTWYECPISTVDGTTRYEPHKLEHLALALESEWLESDGNLLDDFLKLAVCVAETRVMIFQARTIGAAAIACRMMMDAARRVRTGTDADYLFACYVRDVADPQGTKSIVAIEDTFPFRFWRARLQGPLVPVPPA